MSGAAGDRALPPGPLAGIRVVELAAIGPAPFAAMMLADMGADVITVDRRTAVPDPMPREPSRDLLRRGRRSIGVDLKTEGGRDVVLRLADRADAFLEGFRPGVVERLGLDPDTLEARNPRLVYGRMTGWGQKGPLAQAPGHDINYLSVAGALEPMGRAGEPPTPPLNLVADFGGGGMFLAFGVVCALLERTRSGKGQVLDAAMVDGTAVLMTMIHGHAALGLWNGGRGENLLDGGAHFYQVYETSDGRYVSVGALEPQFYQHLCRALHLEEESPQERMDPRRWPRRTEELRRLFRTRTQKEWCELLEGTDACVAPVLSFRDAPRHPHNRARATFVEHAGQVQPAPAPRFSRTAGCLGLPPPHPGQHTIEILEELGMTAAAIASLRQAAAIA